MRTHLIAFAALTLISSARPELLPVEDFSHEQAYYGPTLSPDGKAVAYGETVKGESRIYIVDLETKKKSVIDLEGTEGAWSQGSRFFWASNNRLVFTAHGRRAAVNRDGSHSVDGIYGGEPVYLFRNDEGSMLLEAYDYTSDAPLHHVYFYVQNRPFIVKVNTRTGAPMRAVENPGNVVAWGVNPQGVTTVAVEIKGTSYRTVYRSGEEGAWETLPGLDWSDPQTRPIAFSADGNTLYLTRLTSNGTWGVYPYDLHQRKLGDPLLVNERYDIVPGQNAAVANGIYVQRAVLSPDFRTILGVQYTTDFPKTAWLDEGLAQMQAGIDQALAQKINTVVSLSDDLQRAIILSWSATDPGTYYLFDRKEQKLEKFLMTRPWIDPAKMADVFPIRYKARDGLLINGYITFPKGLPQKNLPLVVLPHSDPWSRDTWSFDSTAQFFANRGYAVLQVNFRGSGGYGEAFRNAGKRKLGQESEFDIADGVRWAIRQGLADPKRVGIIGFGAYGGYMSLMGLAAEPDLYTCGIASAAYTDWLKVIDKTVIDKDEYAFMVEWFGDPSTDKEALRATSPMYLANKIKAPTLLIHNGEDDPWAYNQSKTLSANLTKAGRESEFHSKYSDLHYGFERHGKWLKEMETFLAAHMPADPVPAK